MNSKQKIVDKTKLVFGGVAQSIFSEFLKTFALPPYLRLLFLSFRRRRSNFIWARNFARVIVEDLRDDTRLLLPHWLLLRQLLKESIIIFFGSVRTFNF